MTAKKTKKTKKTKKPDPAPENTTGPKNAELPPETPPPANPDAEAPQEPEVAPPPSEAPQEPEVAPPPSEASQEQEAPALTEKQARELLMQCLKAIHELRSATGLTTIQAWEFTRARAHRPDAPIITQLQGRIEAALGQKYVPVSGDGNVTDNTPKGVKFMNT